MERYILQPDEVRGWWVITDTKYMIAVRFKQNEFGTKKYASILQHPHAKENELRRVLRTTNELYPYLRVMLPHIAF